MIDNSQDRLNAQSIWRNWLTLAPPQMSLNFDMAIGRDRIAAAASIVDSDAPAPLRSRTKLELYKGKIPAIKEKFRMSQDDMREIEVLRALPIVGGNTSEALIRFLMKDLEEASVSGDKRIDLMVQQAISTLTIDVNTTNNPDGVAYGVIDLLAQSYQKQGVPTVWTDPASTPVTDIQNFIEYNLQFRGRQFGSIKMSYALWLNFKKTTEVKTFLAGFFNTKVTSNTFAITISNINEAFAANNWPPIEIINYVSNIEVDGQATFVRGFNQNNVAFTPAGMVGTLFNAWSMEQLHPVGDKTYANYGPTLVSKWCESDPLVEFTAMEMNAFPSINIDNVFVLTTNVVQASFV
jgi:hypothetical protein